MLMAKKYPNRKIAEAIEESLHRAFGDKRIRGEWFALEESEVKQIMDTLS